MTLENYTYGSKLYAKFRNPHGPLLTTYLGMLLRAGADESEVLFHGFYLIFPFIGVISMYFLARRFTGQPLLAALLFLFTPGFLVLSHTLMDNLPGLSLGLAAAALFVWGVDRENSKMLLASGLVLTLAVLTSYQALSLVPAFLFYSTMSKPHRLKKFLPFFMLAIGGTLWLLATYKIYGRLPAISYKVRGQYYQWPGFEDYSFHILQILTFLAGATVFPLSVIPIFFRRKMDLLMALTVLPPLAVWAVLAKTGNEILTGPKLVQFALLICVGFMIVYRLFVHGISAMPWGKRTSKFSADSLFLFTWFISVIAVYMAFIVPYVAVRHLLLLFPPIILVFVREAEKLWPSRDRLRTSFLAATLLFTLAGGLAAAIADYRSASIYPRIAQQLEQQYDQYAKNGSTIYVKGEFSFRYYLEKQGFTLFNDKSEIKPGDIIFFSLLESPSVVPWPEASYLELERIEPGDAFPFRIWNLWAGAGFYGDPMGPLPLVISQAIHDRIIVYQVRVAPPQRGA